MRKGFSYLAYGVAAGVVLVGASHDALRAAGSSANEKDDKQLTAAIDLLHGVKLPEPAVKADAAPAKSDATTAAAPATPVAPTAPDQATPAKPN